MNESDTAPSTYTNEQMEECDMESEDDVKLYVIDKEDGSAKLEVSFIIAKLRRIIPRNLSYFRLYKPLQ